VRDAGDEDVLRIHQVLIDPDMQNDWEAGFEINLAASRETRRPMIRLTRIGSFL